VIGLEADVLLLGSLIVRGVSLITSFLFGGGSYLKLTSSLKNREFLDKKRDI
jgi:hypothetical protein